MSLLLGWVSLPSLGHNIAEFWNNLSHGRSGVSRITIFDPSDLRCQVGAEVTDFDYTPYFGKARDAKRADRYIGFSVAASKIAVEHAGLDFSERRSGQSWRFPWHWDWRVADD